MQVNETPVFVHLLQQEVLLKQNVLISSCWSYYSGWFSSWEENSLIDEYSNLQ